MPEQAEVVTPLPPFERRHPSTATAPRPRRRRIVSTAVAFGCAIGMLACSVLPVLGSQAVDQPAASLPQQHLSGAGGFAGHDSFDALASAPTEAVGDPVDFINFSDALVQFPFASGQPLSDGFGMREFPVHGMHDAQDFAAAAETPVQAIADGRVLEVGWNSDGCGYGILLEHLIDGKQVESRYCHLSAESSTLRAGDQVRVADPVGRVGSTGLAFGPHLHFVLRVEGEAVDPMPFLTQYNRQTRVR